MFKQLSIINNRESHQEIKENVEFVNGYPSLIW